MINNNLKKITFLTLALLTAPMFSMDQNNWNNNNFYNNNTNNNFDYNMNNNQYENQNLYNIFDAILMNDFSGIQQFLNNGINANIQDENGNTPLHILCNLTNPNAQIAKLLIQNNANPFIKNNNGQTPFDLANNCDAIKTILNNCPFSLFVALDEKNEEKAKNIILNNKESIYSIDQNGNNPLHIAAQNNFPEIIKLILKTNSDMALIKNNQGQTFSDLEIFKKNLYSDEYDIIRTFLFFINNKKYLNAAATIGDLTKIQYLLNVDYKNSDSSVYHEAFFLTCEYGHLDI